MKKGVIRKVVAGLLAGIAWTLWGPIPLLIAALIGVFVVLIAVILCGKPVKI